MKTVKLIKLIADLEEARAKASSMGWDDPDVWVWLPGSRIALGGVTVMTPECCTVLVEGNVKPGGALRREFA